MANSLAELLWMCSTAKIQVKTNQEASQFTIHNQFNQFIQSVRQFVGSFVAFVYIKKTKDITQRGVRYNTLSSPFFIVICFQLVHINGQNFVRCVSQQNTGLCFDGQIFGLRKEKKSLTNYCQSNRTLELCYVRDFVVCLQRTSNCKDYTTNLPKIYINIIN